MMNRAWQLIVCGLVAISLTVGCGRSPSTVPNASGVKLPLDGPVATSNPTSPDSPAMNPATSGITSQVVHKIPIEKLEIGDYMPRLDDGDGGYVEIATPEGWVPIPRNSDYLMRFHEPKRKGLPRIELKVETRSYGDLVTVTSENVEQFAKLVAAELSDVEFIIENVVPMLIGETACARYVSFVRLESTAGITTVAERQRLMVLHNGRLYTIDLLVNQNTLRQSRNAAYAVCAGLRFGQETEPSTAGDLLPN